MKVEIDTEQISESLIAMLEMEFIFQNPTLKIEDIKSIRISIEAEV